MESAFKKNKFVIALVVLSVIIIIAVNVVVAVKVGQMCNKKSTTAATATDLVAVKLNARPQRLATEVMTGEDADAALQSADPTMVFVYADWCGFCKRADPIFTELSKDPAYKHVRLLKLNSAQAPTFVAKHGIRGYPVFLLNWAQGDAAKVVGFKSKPEMVAMLNTAPRERAVRLEIMQESAAIEALKAPTPSVVFVSADWCGFCKKLIPIWDEVVASGKFSNINLMRIDAKHAPELIKTHGITGFPVLLSNRGERKYVGYRPKDKLEEVLTAIGGSGGARIDTRRCPVHQKS